MSLDDATRIVARLGPCTLALDRACEPDLARSLALLGCIVRDLGGEAGVAVVRAVHRSAAIPAGIETLAVIADRGERDTIETPWLADGWHRHPASLLAIEAPAWTATTLPRLTFYRRGTCANLLAGGVETDAAIERFAAAADLVRSGDHVAVVGGDTAAGVAIVAALSRGREVTALDPADLAASPPHTLDTLILTANDLDPALLAAAEAALKPDGRLLLGWTGEGAAIEAAAAERFIIDRRLHQADGGTLLIASADPFAAAVPYHHPAFHHGEADHPVLVDFAAAYDNPHLYRTMIQLGERIGDEMVLARLAECVLEDARPASADRGAALAVLGYRVFDLALIDSIGAVTTLIDAYLAATDGTNAPHVLRWRLSLLFLAGRLAELSDDPAAAIARFRAASFADWAGFSPILATKAIAACFHEARLHLASDDRKAAAACFRRGLTTALAAAAAPHGGLIGDHATPLPFYFQEMAEVLDMGGQCAVALNALPLLDRDPGLFWRQVDIKRFGLFAWANALQLEQKRFRAAA